MFVIIIILEQKAIMSISLVILWILATFVIGTVAGVLGKRFGVEYPITLVSALIVMANIFANKQFGLGF